MKLSVLIPSYNEEGNIVELNKKLIAALKDIDYELIYIDDGSSDKTLEKMRLVSRNNKKNVRYISFSRNFGKEAAIYAGLKEAKGEYICIIDADLQQNPKYVVEMYEKLESNKDIDQVVMVMDNRNKENVFNRLAKKMFYKIMNLLSDVKFVDGASDFRMFNKRVKESILSISEYNRFSKGIFSWVGFNTVYMKYTVEERFSGVSKFNFKAQLKYAMTAITNYSVKPLNMSIIIGAIIGIISCIYIVITILQVLLYGKDVPGYASLLIVCLFMGSLQLIFIGVLGSYLGKTYMETKSRPIYLIKETEKEDDK